MQDRSLYEYAVIRVVPRVEREEFLNVGIILFCKKEKYLKTLYKMDQQRLRLLCEDLDLEQVRKNIEAFEKICRGDSSAGPIAQMDTASRFRWLTAVRSSVIQTSRPHPGLCEDLEKTMERLYKEMVM